MGDQNIQHLKLVVEFFSLLAEQILLRKKYIEMEILSTVGNSYQLLNTTYRLDDTYFLMDLNCGNTKKILEMVSK